MQSNRKNTLYYLPPLLLITVWTIFSTSTSFAEGIGMVTGSKVGTYIQFGENIAQQSATAGVDILVKESEGSIDNIRRMNSRENAALGIVQSDVLGFLTRSNSAEMKKIAKRIRMIFPFYNEEIHLFANRSIQSVKDLQGKRVIIGKSGSGNWLTATNLMKIAGVKAGETLNLSPDKGVVAILKGEADAIFYVAGKPVKLFTTLGNLKKKPQYAPLFDKVHFVSITDPAIMNEYETSHIGPQDYAWLSGKTPTAAVKAVLVSFDFSSKSSPYFRQRCQALGEIGRVIRDNIGSLKANGHPKWKEVNLEANVGIWKLDTCSRSSFSGNKSNSNDSIADELEKELMKELGQ